MKNGSLFAVALFLTLILLCGCPAPLDSNRLALFKDLESPIINLVSPADYSEYSTVIKIEGEITDSSFENMPEGSELSVDYFIAGSSISGTISLDLETGGFSSIIDASMLDGNQVVEISVSDLNGNSTSIRRNLTKPSGGGDISNFLVVPGDQMVEIRWDDVPSAESYTLYEHSFGGIIENVTSPYVVPNLDNWKTYCFQIEAVMPDSIGEDAYSALVSKMPLGTRELSPWITDTGYGSITIEWFDAPQAPGYVLERSLNPSGPWVGRSYQDENIFIDDSIVPGESCFYRVRPENNEDVYSDMVCGTAGRFLKPVITGSAESSGGLNDICCSGDYAYLIDTVDGLVIYDISDPYKPRKKTSVSLSGYPNDLEFSGGYIFIAQSGDSNALAIIDVRDPEHPKELDDVGLTSPAYDLSIRNGYAYVADSSAGLCVIDVQNPASPGVPEYFKMEGDNASYRCLCVSGKYVYIYREMYGGLVFDLSDPAQPTDPVTFNLSVYAYDMYAYANYLYFSAGSKVHRADISSPSAPGVVEVFYSGGSTDKKISILDGYSYIADGGGVAIVSIDDPSRIFYCPSEFSASALVLDGDMIYIADSGSGLTIMHGDIISPADDVLYIDTDYASEDLCVSGNYAYVASSKSGLEIFDITESSSPVKAAVVETTGTWGAYDVDVSGNYAFVANHDDGLAVIEVSDPYSPGAPIYMGIKDTAFGIEVNGRYAYIAADEAGIAIIDIGEPSDPGYPYYIPLAGSARDIESSEGYLFVASNASGLSIIDLTNPESPGVPDYVPTNAYGAAVDVAYADGYVYVACLNTLNDEDSTIAVINVSNPASPGEPMYIDIADRIFSVDISGGYAFIAAGFDGMAVIDVSDPENPGDPFFIETTASFNSIDVSGSYAYAAAAGAGLGIIDLLGDRR